MYLFAGGADFHNDMLAIVWASRPSTYPLEARYLRGPAYCTCHFPIPNTPPKKQARSVEVEYTNPSQWRFRASTHERLAARNVGTWPLLQFIAHALGPLSIPVRVSVSLPLRMGPETGMTEPWGLVDGSAMFSAGLRHSTCGASAWTFDGGLSMETRVYQAYSPSQPPSRSRALQGVTAGRRPGQCHRRYTFAPC